MTSGPEREENGHGGLFRGMSFWLSQNVPQTSRFREMIQQHGGIVKLCEKDADIKLVDHKKKNLPPNVYSYQFVEKSIHSGELENLETYKAGPSAARPVGATNIPTKGHRLAYSIQDDQILWDYMQPLERDPSARIRGNKVYQDLAAKHPRHTYQSWRDRYLKRVRGLPRPGGMAEPTVAITAGEQVRTESPSNASTSRPQRRPAVVIRPPTTESPQRPQEKKRKRSPEPTTPSKRISNDTSSTQLTKATTQRPAEFKISPNALHQRGEPSHHRAPRSPGKAKTTMAKPPAEKASPREPVEETSTDINGLFLELPFFPLSSPGPESDEEAPEQDIDAWIDEHLRTGKGNEVQIIEALRCTSMDPELADKVLESFVAGKGIPSDMRGVWTPEDDRCVETQEARKIQRVLEKHGSDLFNSRWEYLNMARSEGLENPPTT
ncbi:hypothetical protein BDW59DRAFT_5664 [Aspergillus cavernicola]|uniref:DNA-binding protein RAP1 n=1 Tax=Aspergillus cavernicola TaxID=176166 RepID=A0ABR4J5D4_9EURO